MVHKPCLHSLLAPAHTRLLPVLLDDEFAGGFNDTAVDGAISRAKSAVKHPSTVARQIGDGFEMGSSGSAPRGKGRRTLRMT